LKENESVLSQRIIGEQIKENKMTHIYLLFGTEEYLKEQTEKQIKNKVYNGDFPEFNCLILKEDINLEEVENFFETYPMMSDTKYVFVSDSNIFSSSKEAASSETTEFWKKRLADIPDYLYIVFSEKNIDKRGALYKLVKKNHTACEFTHLDRGDLTTWIERLFLKNGHKIAKENALYIAEICGGDLTNINNECDKLINYSAETITRSDINNVMSKPIEVRVFDITDGMIEGNTNKVLETLGELHTMNTSAFQLLYLLNGTFEKMLQVLLLLNDGHTVADIADTTKINRYFIKKYINGAKQFGEEFLCDMIISAAKIDLGIKQGRLNENNALDNYIITGLHKIIYKSM